MVVGRARLERAVEALAAAGGDVRALAALVREQGLHLRDLRAAIMRARMVQVSELLERAPLIVRGLSKSSGKPVRLSIDAGNAELDKAVGERLLPVIVHLLRNAVDHAIEPADERAAAGKPLEGRLRIVCAERGGSRLELQVTDDGRGIDREAVAARAGLPVPATDTELLALIVRPGLSTLDAATHTSGRGLGMEIVKRIVVDELGGSLGMTTEAGVGTTFRVEVPLSVTIVDAFAFACGGDTFVVAASAVEELREVEPGAVVDAPRRRGAATGARLLRLRDRECPLYSLAPLLGAPAGGGPRPKAILLRDERGAIAFEVDRMIGRQEIVVRPIADPLVRVKGVAGTTDLGDGRPTLVLDLLALAPDARPVVAEVR
jgi:two-component system chemotaxis sensor kinase CheA